MDHTPKLQGFSSTVLLRFILFNAVGIFMFFVPISIGGVRSIPVDHLVTALRRLPYFDPIYGTTLLILGALLPFVTKQWRKDSITTVFSFFKLMSLPILFLWWTGYGPSRWFEPDLLPFLYNKVVLPVTSLVPVGAVFLAFLIHYGLMEFIGVLMQPVMRPIWRTPGRSAVDAVASFVGSYSVGLLITNRVYREGFYSTREAAIIATGFSTVSATFMIVVARTLGLMDHWNIYFWTTLFITFLVTAITTRIPPLATQSTLGYQGQPLSPEPTYPSGYLFSTCLTQGFKACEAAPSLATSIRKNFLDGLLMALNIGPSLLSVGFFGLLLAEYTPLFQLLAYLFLPFTLLLGFGSEAVLVGKGCAISLVEMFLPANLVLQASPLVRYVTAIVSVSEILFFSASIPCILGTQIGLSLKNILLIWLERVLLSLLFASLAVRFLFPLLGLPLTP